MEQTLLILVAEDEDNDFLFLQKAFDQNSSQVRLVRVRDGAEAIEYLSQPDNPFPDLLILDLRMPRCDGFEVLEWARNGADLKTLVMVVLSSSSESEDVNRAYALGANSYLVKPRNYEGFQELARIVTNYWLRWAQRPRI